MGLDVQIRIGWERVLFLYKEILGYPQKFTDDFTWNLCLSVKMKTELNSNCLSLFQDNIHFKGNILLEIYKTNFFLILDYVEIYEKQSAQ